MIKINTNFIPPSSKTFIVGGTVRDAIAGIPPKDIDIVTLDDAKLLAESISANTCGRTIELGKSGMNIFRIVSQHQTIDIAPANGNSIEEDLYKRDFTINAMALTVNSKNIIDPHNGIKDLENRVIRMVSADNLRADPIRLLRAYRIGAMLDFAIDENTRQAITKACELINTSPGERIRDELIQLFETSRSHYYVNEMNHSGLLTALFPELAELKGCSQNSFHKYDAFEHTLKAYEFLEKFLHTPESHSPDMLHLTSILPAVKYFPLLKYSILLHDIGKPAAKSIDATGRIHFYTHEAISADMAANISRRLRLSNREQKYTDFIIRNHLKPLALFTAHQQNRLSEKAITRFFLRSEDLTSDLLIHTAADLYGKGINKNIQAFSKFLNHMIQRLTESFLPKKSIPPLINGNDLINEFGLSPSPLFSKILHQTEVERISGNISNRTEALLFVKNFLNLA